MNEAKNGQNSTAKKFYGKYRATVVNNIDPLFMGRIMVMVSDVSSLIPTSWALPCVPLAGIQMGISVVPMIGANVWVEFEQGDPDYPIWVGCYWSEGEVPILAQAGLPISPNIVLQSSTQNAIIISDLPGPTGGIMLKSSTGLATIIVNDTHIRIQNGASSIELTAVGVIINNGALSII